MKFSSILFDMDGVLVDNNNYHYRSFELFLQKYKIEFTPDLYLNKITGRTNEVIMRLLFGDEITQAEVDKFAFEKEEIYREIYRPDMKLAPGLMELLDFVHQKGITCAVATNGPVENIDFVLDENGIRKYFQVLVNATMVKDGKPAPDVYLKAAELLGKSNDQCVIFEDSPTGVKAGIAAKIKVIGVTTAHEMHELAGTEFAIKDFTDPRLIEIF